MKVLCISKWAKTSNPEERDAILPKEVPATLKLYLDGVIEQMWFKLDAPGVVFLVNAESIDAAKTHVHGLPLGQAGLMEGHSKSERICSLLTHLGPQRVYSQNSRSGAPSTCMSGLLQESKGRCKALQPVRSGRPLT